MADQTYPRDNLDIGLFPGILRAVSVLSRVTSLPGGPAEGDRHILTATGDVNKIAEWHAESYGTVGVTTTPAWVLIDPWAGLTVLVTGESVSYIYNGSAWVTLASLIGTHTHYHETHTVTAGDVAAGYVDLVSITYTTGNGSLTVYGPLLLALTTDYTETSVSRVTFMAGALEEGQVLQIFCYR